MTMWSAGDRFVSCPDFASPKSRTLTPDLAIMMLLGLQIAVDDALAVRLRQRGDNLRGITGAPSSMEDGPLFEPGR